MAHNIRILDSGVVEIVHTGDMTIHEATISRKEAAAQMEKLGLQLVLADVSKTNHSQSTPDLFEFNSTHYQVFPEKMLTESLCMVKLNMQKNFFLTSQTRFLVQLLKRTA